MIDNLIIAPNLDNIDIDGALIYKLNIEDGFTYPIAEQHLEYENYLKFLEDLEKLYPELKKNIFSFNNDIFEVLKTEDFRLTVSGSKVNTFLVLYSKNVDIAEKIFKIIKKYSTVSTEVEVMVTNYSVSLSGGMNISHKDFELKDYENISDEYYPYIETDEMFKQFYASKENILISCGVPGCGKSKMISLLLKYSILNPKDLPYVKTSNPNIDIDFISIAYVKNTDILAMDAFWIELSEKEFDLVVLDDLDYFLTSRDNEVQSEEEYNKNKFLSQFLSFTDGIEEHKTKFIITSNQPFDDMDDALLRKGRLFDILELRELTKSEALKIWKSNNLSEDKFNELNFKDSILQADLGSEIDKALNTKVKFKKYLKEDNISKLFKESKKLGF